jgi:hypothetical protein
MGCTVFIVQAATLIVRARKSFRLFWMWNAPWQTKAG